MTLNYWVKSVASETNIENSILQMDIDYSEYEVILDTQIETFEKFSIMYRISQATRFIFKKIFQIL